MKRKAKGEKMFKTNLGKLINGDALEFIKTLENDSVDLILTIALI
ncbi:hypothetical protein [Spiroplasma sp. ChiS]|nr:hypothetical protein [Spiroplasma sp. ChiS]